MEPLKYIYSHSFIDNLANELKEQHAPFDVLLFKKEVLSDGWDNLELKQRMSRISDCILRLLPSDPMESTDILETYTASLLQKHSGMSFPYMFIPDCLEKSLLAFPERAFDAFEKVTVFTSCEFAVRPFLIKYQDYGLSRMLAFSQSKKEEVRRFASEGCRPRLPWGLALPALKKDATPIFPILSKLMQDDSEFVRRSVANNLNDISKDHPETILQFAHDWLNKDRSTEKLLKHALRTLLKKGNTRALGYFGINEGNLSCNGFHVEDKVNIGDRLTFSFEVENLSDEELMLRIEYRIYFLLANGSHNSKVFKISERNLQSRDKISLTKAHSFRSITTRRFYDGLHHLSIILNGVEMKKQAFILSNQT